ncbi:MAG: hypothetical protein RL762_1812 [Bacteroidota bacterium]|jgi:uncharacterized delta-60 repeat protein
MRHLLLCLFLISNSVFFAQITKEWVYTFNGHGDFNDQFTCSATDLNGNIILAGSSVNPNSDRDYLVCKYNANGTLIWKNTLNGLGSGTDEITAIVTDAQNNIYVTGFSKGYNTSTDFLTVKYNSNGDTIWTRSYDFVLEYDQANSIAIDNSGNIFVTGQSDSDPSSNINDDYLTIKYNMNGTLLWTKRFNGLGNAIDRAVKIVVDNTSSCYITGRSNNGSDDDYVTIKYNASGVQSWIKYDDRGGWDRASAIAIDASNNIYITGKSQNNANYDYWTIKYNSNGSLQYQQAYDFVDDDNATAIAVDNNGNCFVTGASDADPSALQNFDFQTLAYNPNGQLLWQKRYNGTANNDDTANSIIVNSTSVVICGNTDKDLSSATSNNGISIAYAISNGAQNWTNEITGSNNDASLFVLNYNNSTIMVGYSEDANFNKNAIAAFYNQAGTTMWNASFNGIGDNNDNIRGIAVDNANYIHLCGYSVQKGTNRNLNYLNVTPGGQLSCQYDLDGTATGSTDDAQGLIVDNNGQAIIGGFLRNKSSSNDIELLSMNPQVCDTNWTITLDGIGIGSDKIYDIQKDNSGFIYVTGRQDVDNTNNSNDNAYTAKLNANGTLVWQKLYNSSSANEDRGELLKISPQGNIYTLGKSWNGSNYDLFLLKYDQNGNQIWVQTFNSNKNDLPQDLAIDASENIYIVSNKIIDTIGVSDITILKYNANGQLTWNVSYDGGDDDKAIRLSEVISNKITLIGTTDSDTNELTTNYDILVLCYDLSGNQLWNYKYNGLINSDDIGDDIAISDFGNVYLTGHTNKSTSLSPNYDIVTQILDPNGVQIWQDIYNGTADSSDIPNILLLKDASFYIAGSSVESNEMKNALLIKYTGTVGLSDITLENDFCQIYPNPTTNTLFIESASNQNEVLNIQITNIEGNTVLIDQTTGPLTSLQFGKFNPGIYFIQLTNASGQKQVKKVIKI